MKWCLRYVTAVILILYGNLLAAQRPVNIILIMADDLGYGDVGCYGQQKVATPNIDKLARSGMRFTQFYAGTAVCAPSRASLMTGLHTGHTPIRGNRGFQPEGQFPLPDSTVTIASLLQQAGYATAAFGKWGMGYPGSTGEPLNKGFDHFFGYNCQTLAHNYYPAYLWSDKEQLLLPDNEKDHTVYSADLIHEKAKHFLQQQQGKPFFLFLPYTIPHGDLLVPHDAVYDGYVKKFNEQPRSKPANPKPNKPFEPYPHAAFAAMVTRLDSYVGEIVQLVYEKGLADNTLIIFTSDNGPHHEDGGDPDFFDGNGIYKGIKRDLYEGGIRLPFIASWKGVIKYGSVNNQPLAMWDLYPTFLQLAGLPVTQKIDGISIIPALTGKKQPLHKYLYWEFHEQGGKQAVLWNNWKGIRLQVSSVEDAPIELYDLSKDPSENNNVAAQHPNVVKKIAQFMQEAHVPNPDWPVLKSEMGDKK